MTTPSANTGAVAALIAMFSSSAAIVMLVAAPCSPNVALMWASNSTISISCTILALLCALIATAATSASASSTAVLSAASSVKLVIDLVDSTSFQKRVISSKPSLSSGCLVLIFEDNSALLAVADDPIADDDCTDSEML